MSIIRNCLMPLYSFTTKVTNAIGYVVKEKNPLFAKEYVFTDRQSGGANLLLILAGFQPYYWDTLLARINKIVKDDKEETDVCICIPEGLSGAREKLERIAKEYGWSVLFIFDDLLAQAQNTAIKLHPKAQFIFKLDEDIVISSNYISRMKEVFVKTSKVSPYRVGYVSPVLNVNDYGSQVFIKSLNLADEYKSKFGEFTLHQDNSKVFKDPQVAVWLWQKSIPFDKVAHEIAEKNANKYSCSPVRVRIGAILISRDFWEEKGGFLVPGLSQLGTEELDLVSYCTNRFYKIVIAEDVFCGHLGFSQQKEACRLFFEQNKDKI